MQQLPVFLTASKPRLHWVRRLLTLWNSVRSKSHSSSYKSEESYDLESLHVDVIEFRMVVNFVYWLVWCLLLICLLPVVTFFPTSFFMRRWRVRIFSGQLHFGEGQTQCIQIWWILFFFLLPPFFRVSRVCFLHNNIIIIHLLYLIIHMNSGDHYWLQYGIVPFVIMKAIHTSKNNNY